MAYYNYASPEYKDDLYSLFEHSRRVSDRNEVPIEVIIEDLIMRNLMDY